MLDLFCLSLVVYVEARGEPIDGQMLVAEVVINRTQADRFPDDVCSVVFDEAQFSGVTTNLDLFKMFSDPAWSISTSVAEDTLDGKGLSSGATHFHTVDSKPYWSKHLTRLGQYGNHVFYQEEEYQQ